MTLVNEAAGENVPFMFLRRTENLLKRTLYNTIRTLLLREKASWMSKSIISFTEVVYILNLFNFLDFFGFLYCQI